MIREIVNGALAHLDGEFDRLYESMGRASVAPERLLRASLLQAFYSVRSERQLMEQIYYNLLFRWFVGLGFDDPVWDHSTFSKNRDRLLDAEVAWKFLEAVLRHLKVKRFLSDEHFTVDGTLIEAWAFMKSVRAKDGSGEPPGHGPRRQALPQGPRRRGFAMMRRASAIIGKWRASTRGREYTAEAAGGEPEPGQGNASGRHPAKNVKPGRARQLVDYLRESYRISVRRACQAYPLDRSTYTIVPAAPTRLP